MRIEYEFIPVQPFLTVADFDTLAFELDIGNWGDESYALGGQRRKPAQELHTAKGITLPSWTRQASRASISLSTILTSVSLFPVRHAGWSSKWPANSGTRRSKRLFLRPNNYVSQLARPSLDTLLQDIYRNRCKLIVVFVGDDYQRKTTGWRPSSARFCEIIMARAEQRIMFVRVDDGAVDGVFRTDGYVDARRFNPSEIAQFIAERVALIT